MAAAVLLLGVRLDGSKADAVAEMTRNGNHSGRKKRGTPKRNAIPTMKIQQPIDDAERRTEEEEKRWKK